MPRYPRGRWRMARVLAGTPEKPSAPGCMATEGPVRRHLPRRGARQALIMSIRPGNSGFAAVGSLRSSSWDSSGTSKIAQHVTPILVAVDGYDFLDATATRGARDVHEKVNGFTDKRIDRTRRIAVHADQHRQAR